MTMVWQKKKLSVSIKSKTKSKAQRHNYNLIGRLGQEDCLEFEARLGYKACIRPARGMEQNSVSNKQKQTTKTMAITGNCTSP